MRNMCASMILQSALRQQKIQFKNCSPNSTDSKLVTGVPKLHHLLVKAAKPGCNPWETAALRKLGRNQLLHELQGSIPTTTEVAGIDGTVQSHRAGRGLQEGLSLDFPMEIHGEKRMKLVAVVGNW